MSRFTLFAAVLLISLAVFASAQKWKDGDDDGCVEDKKNRVPGLCIKGNRDGWRGRKESCNGVCVNTGGRGRDRCQCQELRFGNRRPASGWNARTGWGSGK
uniref:Uncharacterized protein n=1 Tax=Plectus sambesii TaxID=2011161 RepID=A0A914WB01_9BILA